MKFYSSIFLTSFGKTIASEKVSVLPTIPESQDTSPHLPIFVWGGPLPPQLLCGLFTVVYNASISQVVCACACMQVCMCVCYSRLYYYCWGTYVCRYRGQRTTFPIVPLSHPYYFFEMRSLTGTWEWAYWPENPRDLLVSTSPVPRL